MGYLHSVIESHFGNSFLGLRLDYIVEDAPLGTGGAIRGALLLASENSVLVLNGDTFLQADYGAMMRFHLNKAAGITIAVTHQADVARYGGVTVKDGRIVSFQEKGQRTPGFINAGAYVLDTNLQWPRTLAEKFSFENGLSCPQINRLAPAAYEVNGFFLDIGVPEDLDRAQTELAGL